MLLYITKQDIFIIYITTKVLEHLMFFEIVIIQRSICLQFNLRKKIINTIHKQDIKFEHAKVMEN